MSKRNAEFVAIVSFCLVLTVCSSDTPTESKEEEPPPASYPAIQLEADNPKIVDVVSQVRQDSLVAYIQSLVGFFTRHTNSDTVSGTQGIGAARRWVFNRFDEIRRENGDRLQVYYHSFEANIRGVFGLHRNVIAELPGTATPDRVFLVSGHLDSRNGSSSDAVGRAAGANDDGSGVAAVIEVARILSQFEFRSTLIFVAFTGEEQGLFGSRAYAQHLRAIGTNVVGMVTNDVIGNIVGGSGNVDSTSVRCFSDNPNDSPHRQLARFIKLQGEAYLPGFTVNLIQSRDRPGRGGDHFSFNEQGYTGARLTEPEDNLDHQHNMNDLPEFMSFPYLTRVVKLNAAYLSSLADGPIMPSNLRVLTQDGGGRKIIWDQPGGTADVSNYLLAFRRPFFATYDSLISLGKVNEFSLGFLPNLPDSLFLSISAVDPNGNESLFSHELFVE